MRRAQAFWKQATTILGDIGSNQESLRSLEPALGRLTLFVGAGLSAEFGYPTWSELLATLAKSAGLSPQIETLLADRQYEEVAELIDRNSSGMLSEGLRRLLSADAIVRPIDRGAVRHLPRLAHGLVITTNFDAILEMAFDDASNRFEDVFAGSRVAAASEAIQGNEHVLLKLHGSYNEVATRVLTRTEYDRHYNLESSVAPEGELVDVLDHAFSSRSVLFLGCSLRTDRTMAVLESVLERRKNLQHFALLPDADNTTERVRQLRRWHITPLFYREGEYVRVERFLDLVARYLETPRRRQLPRSLLVVPVAALVAAGWWGVTWLRGPRPPIKVVRETQKEVIVRQVRTDGSGRFSTRVDPDSYTVLFELPNYETVRYENVLVSTGSGAELRATLAPEEHDKRMTAPPASTPVAPGLLTGVVQDSNGAVLRGVLVSVLKRAPT